MVEELMGQDTICVGEVLWDVLPNGTFLGGAPFNVACQLSALGQPARFAGRVGDDLLGRNVHEVMRSRGIPTELLQTDPALPTGEVFVDLSDPQAPKYQIVQPAAWDALDCTASLLEAALNARAIVFGTLAQRQEPARSTIRRLLGSQDWRVLDINLREPFDDVEVVRASLELANALKLNDQELNRLQQWFDLPGGSQPSVESLAARFGLGTVCVTRGGDGAVMFHAGRWHEQGGIRVDVADAIGAGDAFLAGLLTGLLRGDSGDQTLSLANALGAFVASRPSATPVLDFDEIERLRSAPR